MSVLNCYEKEELESALIIAWYVRRNIQLAIRYHDTETLKYGICSEWDDLSRDSVVELTEIRTDLYRAWPEYSGVSWYPIPMPACWEYDYAEYVMEQESEGERPSAASEWMYDNTENMWDGDYGGLRMDCLDYLIHQLEEAVL
jgi:hypothetical protein